MLWLAGCATTSHLSPPQMKAYEVSLSAVDARHLALAWQGTTGDARDAIYLRYLHAAGNAAGAPLQLTDAKRHAYEPSLQIFDGEAVIGWYERDDAGRLQACIARFMADGRTRWRVNLSPDDLDGRNPVVRVGAGGIHVAWLQQRPGTADNTATIEYARLDPAGAWLERPREIGTANRDTWNLNAALDAAGTFHLVYDARWQGTAHELQLLRVEHGTTTHVLLSADDGFASIYPDLAIAGDRAALTWFDERDGNQEVYLFAGTVQDLRGPVDGRARRVTHTPGHSIGAYVAWNAGRIGLAWCDDSGGHNRVFEQTFNRRGEPLRAARALTDGRLQGLIPTIVPWYGGFAVGWNELEAEEDGHGSAATRQSFAVLRLLAP